MTLRLRLLLMIGVSMLLLWGGVAVWMLHGLEQEMQRTLDQRLEMSAHMVAGLMSQNPAAWDGRSGKAGVSTLSMPQTVKGLACQVSLRGEVIAITPGAAPQAIDQVGPGFVNREIRGEHWRSYTLDKLGLRVTTSDRLSERSTLLRNVMVAAVVPFVVALLGSLLVLWFGVGSGLRPLERLRQVLASRTPDSLTPIENAPIARDLQPLVNTLNHLLARVSETFSRERRFTSDAAHELRTPLTAIKIHLQVARITHGQEAAVAMDYAEEGVARLGHTLSQLLTLSQVEGAFSWEDGSDARADEIARLAIRDAAPHAPESVLVNSDAGDAELALPRALAVTALRNLLENALRHSPASAADSHAELLIRAGPEWIVFHVVDRGPGLSPDELAVATQRFWRRETGHGSGLGLSIVAAVAARFGGLFELLQRAGGGLEAKLTLPRKPTGEEAP